MATKDAAAAQERRERSQREALGYVVRQINASLHAGRTIDKKPVHDAKSLFRALDVDGDGALSREEITRGLTRLDVAMEDALFQLLLDTMDLNQDGLIDMAEFLRALSVATYPAPPSQNALRRKSSLRGKLSIDKAAEVSEVKTGTKKESTLESELKRRLEALENELSAVRSSSEEQQKLVDHLQQRLADAEANSMRAGGLMARVRAHPVTGELAGADATRVSTPLASPVQVTRPLLQRPSYPGRPTLLQHMACSPQTASTGRFTAAALSKCHSQKWIPSEPMGA